jgi:hypothetical protein
LWWRRIVTREKKILIDDLTSHGLSRSVLKQIDGIPREHLQVSGHDRLPATDDEHLKWGGRNGAQTNLQKDVPLDMEF